MSVRLRSLKTPAIVVASLAAVYLLYVLFAWLALPRILDSQARQYIAEKTGHRLTLDRPVFNPFNLKLRISNLRLERPDGQLLFAFRNLTVDLSASSLFRRALVFDAIALDDPQATLVLKPDGRLNWSAFIDGLQSKEAQPANAAQPESQLPRFDIDSLILTGGRIDFADDRTGFSAHIAPLNLQLIDISSLPNDRDRYRISAHSGAARLLWQGQTMLNPLESTGSLAIDNLDLARFDPYVSAALPGASAAGTASASTDYRIAYAGGRFELVLQNVAAKLASFRLDAGKSGPALAVDLAEARDGRFDLATDTAVLGTLALSGSRIDLGAAHRAPTELLRLSALTVEQARADLGKRRITVERAALKGARFKAVRNAKGRIDVVDALRATVLPVVRTTSQAKEASPPWHYRVNKTTLAGGSATFRDETVAPAADLTLDEIAASVTGIGDDMSAPLPVEVSAHAKGGGSFAATGKVVPAVPAADLQAKVADLAVQTAQPYLASAARLRLVDGRVGTEGRATYGKDGAKYRGRFDVHKLRVLETDTNTVFLSWDDVGTRRFDVTPAGLDIGTLDVKRLYTKLVINPDKSTNIGDILRKPGAAVVSSVPAATPASAPVATPASAPVAVPASSPVAAPAPAPVAAQAVPAESAPAAAPVASAAEQPAAPAATAANETPSFLVNIDRVRILNSEMDFADHSLVLPFETHIHGLRGFINGLSSRPGTAGQIELDGLIDDYGVARGAGQMEFFNPTDFTDVTVVFSNVELTRLSPYSMTFAGRKIDSGKLLLNLEYRIKKRQLEGVNQVIINKITLGERVKSPEALDLPLDLAIALLQDSEGRIDLGVPVTGNLDDPQFSYGAVIWKAFLNIFKMIATAPFRALAALFGGGEQIENVYFDPGSARLSPPQREDIGRLAGVLNKRPRLSMTVHGTYSDADRLALQDRQLRRAVLTEEGIELGPQEEPGPISTSSPKVQAALESLFSRRIGSAELDALKQGFRQANPGEMEQSTVGKMMSRLSNLFQSKRTLSDQEVEQLKGADFYAVLFQRLREREPVTDAQLQTLAARRGDQIYAALKAANAAADRVALGEPEKAESDAKGVPVKLELGVAPEVAAPATPVPATPAPAAK